LLEDLADLEKEMFTELGLHFKILVWFFDNFQMPCFCQARGKLNI